MAARRGASGGAMETAAAAQREALRAFCRERAAGWRLWLASNRGPVEFHERDGLISTRQGQGGLVTALSALAAVTPVHWVAAAMTRCDARVARASGGSVRLDDAGPELSFVTPAVEQYRAYYDAIANGVLWLLQHHVAHAPTEPSFDADTWSAWHDGYVAVNRQFAAHLAALACRAGASPVFLIQDYHLYLVPGLLRNRFPTALIQHFTHIAWPAPDGWRMVPPVVRGAILNSLLACDVVGLQAPRHVTNFLACCAELLGLAVDPRRGEVAVGARTVRVRAYPISIDPGRLLAQARSPAAMAAGDVLDARGGLRTLAIVARTDPAKNVLRTLRAYDYFLARFPQWHGHVRLVALLPLSRQSCPVFRAHAEAIAQECERIGRTWMTGGWQPIEVQWEHDHARAVALLARYDVLLVTSIADGMNLVAKEGPTVNTRCGALVLSEGAGACDELGRSAHVVNPFDVVALAEAMDAALREGPRERAANLAAQRESIQARSIYRWAHEQLEDLLTGAGRREGEAGDEQRGASNGRCAPGKPARGNARRRAAG